jgi:hypothetical protein
MDAFLEILNRGFEQLLGRASGPLHLRLLITPTIVTILAIRAGMKDARAGHSTFLSADPAERKELVRSGWKDIGRVFVLAIVLDTVYQLMFLRAFYVVQALIVAVLLAIVPFALFRNLVSRLMRGSPAYPPS